MGNKARSSAAAEKIAGNIHMLWEILIRVPLKPLFRLKCVSKQWLTLISDQQFRDSHSLHHQQHQLYSNSLIFSHNPSQILSITTTTTTFTPRVLNLDFLNQPNVKVVRSCNGLLLCHNYDRITYFICNPIALDFTTLNLGRHPCRDNSKCIDLYLAFEPSISPRFKVVSIATSLHSRLDWVFHVYTFKTRSGIGRGVSVYIPFALKAANGVYCNGAIHWYRRSDFSVYFDVDNQCLKNYPMPLSSSQWCKLRYRRIYYFGESGGRLHLMLPVCKSVDLFDIFELKEDYSGWSLRHRLDLNPIHGEFPHVGLWPWTYHMSCNIFHTAKDKKKKSTMSVLLVGKEGAILHDPVDKTSRKLCDFELDKPSISMWDHLVLSGRVIQHFEKLC